MDAPQHRGAGARSPVADAGRQADRGVVEHDRVVPVLQRGGGARAGVEVLLPGGLLDGGLAAAQPGHERRRRGAQLGRAEQHSPLHLQPSTGGERQQPAEELGDPPLRAGGAHVKDARAAQRLGSVLERLDPASARRGRVVAGRPRSDRHGLKVGGGHERWQRSRAAAGQALSRAPARSVRSPRRAARRGGSPRRRPRGTCGWSHPRARSAPVRSSSARSDCRAPRARGRRSCRWPAGRRCAGWLRSTVRCASCCAIDQYRWRVFERATTVPFSSTSSGMSYAQGSSRR